MGMSAAKAGAILVVLAFGTVLSRLVGVHLTEIVHPRSVAIGGAVLLVVAFLLTSLLDPSWSLVAFYLVLGFQAVTMSMSMMVISAVAYVDIETEQMAGATGLFTTFQQITMALGVMLAVWTMSGMRLLYDATETDSRIYSASFVILAVFAAAGAIAMFRLDTESTGALQRGRR
jgi:MFS family permease